MLSWAAIQQISNGVLQGLPGSPCPICPMIAVGVGKQGLKMAEPLTNKEDTENLQRAKKLMELGLISKFEDQCDSVRCTIQFLVPPHTVSHPSTSSQSVL